MCVSRTCVYSMCVPRKCVYSMCNPCVLQNISPTSAVQTFRYTPTAVVNKGIQLDPINSGATLSYDTALLDAKKVLFGRHLFCQWSKDHFIHTRQGYSYLGICLSNHIEILMSFNAFFSVFSTITALQSGDPGNTNVVKQV